MKKLEWQFSTGIAGGIVFSLGIPGKSGMVGKYASILLVQLLHRPCAGGDATESKLEMSCGWCK